MADLTVIVPSRGRPDAAGELVDAFDETCTASVELVFAVDLDDPELSAYLAVSRDDRATSGDVSVSVLADDTSSMVQALNRAAMFTLGNTPAPFALGFMGDDHRPRTRGWDSRYLDVLSRLGTGIVYGNDLLQGANLPTQCALTSDIVQALGYMAPQGLHHMYVDNFWRDLGDDADCLSYLANVVIEHMHPIAGKAEWDAGHARVNDAAVYQRDAEAYGKFVCSGSYLAAVRAVKALRGPR